MDVRFEVVDPRSPDAVWAMNQYFAELDRRFPGGFDPGDTLTADAHELDPPHGAFVVARTDEVPIAGCGGVRTIDEGVGEIKRMWVDDRTRGQGIGPRLLADLEDRCRTIGHRLVRLDTNEVLTAAIAMYERAGYRRIDRYNDNPYPTHFFEKDLAPPS